MRCDLVVTHRKGNRVKHQCIRCGRLVGWTETVENPYALCRTKGWGDKLHALLLWVGYRGPCSKCNRRRERLNELDRKCNRWFRGPRNVSYSN